MGAGAAPTVPEALEHAFYLKPGSLGDDEPVNFVEFPYDWRHDNRQHAYALKEVIDRKLHLLRSRPATKNARVILLAHSLRNSTTSTGPSVPLRSRRPTTPP